MKVLQIHNAYAGSPGGEDSTVQLEGALLQAAGHQVESHVVTNPDRGPGAALTLAASPWNPRSAKRVGRIVGELCPDVVHVHNLWFALTPSILRPIRASGARIVMTVQNFRLLCVNGYLFRDGGVCEDCVGHLPWRGIVHRCYRDSAAASAISAAAMTVNRGLGIWRRNVDTFVTPSAFVAERLTHAGLPADRIVVKPNFVRDPGPRDLAAEDSPDVLYVGRLEPEKGISDLVDAWARRPPDGLRLTICGDGSLREQLEQRAPSSVTFAGWLPRTRVIELLLRARATVLPSRWYEGQPLAALESFAAGAPVLAADVGAGGELARSLGEDWVSPPGDLDGWSRALAKLTHGSRIAAASRAARAEYESRYSESKALAALERIYG